MYPRTEYEMSDSDLKEILDACKPVPCMMIGSYTPSSQQENANRAWARLGKKLGFDSNTVQPVQGKEQKFFTAVPSETEQQKKTRIEKEEEDKRQERMKNLKLEIAERDAELKALERR